jgi:hypothetical protein
MGGKGDAGANGAPSGTPNAESLRKRPISVLSEAAAGLGPPAKQTSFSKPLSDEQVEEVIKALPDWKAQLSLRGYIVGGCFVPACSC